MEKIRIAMKFVVSCRFFSSNLFVVCLFFCYCYLTLSLWILVGGLLSMTCTRDTLDDKSVNLIRAV
jgi:hypothetical protein